MDTMSDDVKVFEHDAGSADRDTRRQWRRNRQAAYRLAYKEREGKAHPASKQKPEKADEKKLLDDVIVPVGMSYVDFGVTWDFHVEHPFTPVLRKQSVADEWQRALDEEG